MSPLSLFLIWHGLPPSDIRAPASWTFALRQVFITSCPGSQLPEGAWWDCLASVFVGQFPQGISSGTYTCLHPLYPAAYTHLRPSYLLRIHVCVLHTLLHIHVYVLCICRVFMSTSSASATYTCLRPPYLPPIYVCVLHICHVCTPTSSVSAAYLCLRPPHLPRIHVCILRICHVYTSASWGQTSRPTCPVLCSLLPPLPTCARSSPVATAPTMELEEHRPLWGDSVYPASRQRTP